MPSAQALGMTHQCMTVMFHPALCLCICPRVPVPQVWDLEQQLLQEQESLQQHDPEDGAAPQHGGPHNAQHHPAPAHDHNGTDQGSSGEGTITTWPEGTVGLSTCGTAQVVQRAPQVLCNAVIVYWVPLACRSVQVTVSVTWTLKGHPTSNRIIMLPNGCPFKGLPRPLSYKRCMPCLTGDKYSTVAVQCGVPGSQMGPLK
jgi:hypothetical protein